MSSITVTATAFCCKVKFQPGDMKPLKGRIPTLQQKSSRNDKRRHLFAPEDHVMKERHPAGMAAMAGRADSHAALRYLLRPGDACAALVE